MHSDNRLINLPVMLMLATLLGGCAAPFKLDGVNQSIQPQQTLTDPATLKQRVLWGGLIIGTRNFKDHSEIEILSYPLYSDGEPKRTATAQGRFILKQTGFIEPAQYAAGRWISAVGQVQPGQKGQIGEVSYHYPVIEAEKSHLWPEQQESYPQTQFRFGIGISL